MERRYSFNITNVSSPIAESTCLNGTNGASRFQWGGSLLSSKNRSSSSGCLAANVPNAGDLSRSGLTTSPQRKRLNMSKIDPRIYADVQSKGLASRIVKYHEDGARLNRSMSTSNLYSKSGRLPVVHVKKSEHSYKATKPNISVTRIAAPEKSVFYGNTLSSLLRSNSVIGLQKSDEELSHENRPILHPPPTENDLAPTRSVLDVLKEISRKRINSDDSDGHDVTKKYFNQECNIDSIDTIHLPNNIRNVVAPSMQSYKRQRESGRQQQQQQLSQKHSTTSQQSLPSHSQSSPQHSPEQVAKKRLCTYNNEITSSLSSSMIHRNKRKFYEQQQHHRTMGTSNSSISAADEFSGHKLKIQRQYNDLRFQNLTKSLSCRTPITPIPATPQTADTSRVSPTSLSPVESSVAVPPKRTVSEPIYSNSIKTAPLIAPQTTKPKLTLFNKNYDECGTNERTLETISAEEDHNRGECADIPFIKPKKSSSISNARNPLIEKTQKSKLALMLRGLRGELYQDDDGTDIPDAGKKISKEDTPMYTTLTSKTTLDDSSRATISNTVKSIVNTSITATSGIPNATTSTTATTIATSVTTTNKTPSKLPTSTEVGGFKFTPPGQATTANATAPTFTLSVPTAKSTSSPPTTAIDSSTLTKPKFSFGAPTAATSIAATAATGTGTVTSTALPVPVAGGFSFPLKPMTDILTKTTNTPPSTQTNNAPGTFNFATPTTAPAPAPTTTTIATTNKTSTATTPAPFTFGTSSTAINAFNSNNNATSGPSLIPSSSAATTAPTFGVPKAGGDQTPKQFVFAPSNAMTSASVTESKTMIPFPFTSSPPKLEFGSSKNSTTAGKTFAFGNSTTAPSTTTITPATGSFSFGSPLQKPSIATPPFSFGSDKPPAVTSTMAAVPAAAAPSTANTQFSFGNPSATAAAAATSLSKSGTLATSNSFSFGSPATNSNLGATKAAAAAPPTATNSFAFGSTTMNNPPPPFGSGSAATSKPATFTFNAPPTQTAQQNPPAFGGGSMASSKAPSFSFGSTTNDVNKTATGGTFNFGGTTQPSASDRQTAITTTGATMNVFGGGTTSNTATATGIVKPMFNFGGGGIGGGGAGASGVTSSAMGNGKSIFGGNTASAASSNTFGALATAAAANPATTLNASSNVNQSKPFSFGAPSQNSATNIFGTAASSTRPGPTTATNAGNQQPTAAASGGFAFSNTANTAANAQNKPSGIFSFGNATNASTNNTATTAPFTFGGNAAGAPTPAKIGIDGAVNKTFNFGSGGGVSNGLQAPIPSPAPSNIFGVAPTTANTFNFSATGATPQAGAVVLPNNNSNNNIFAPPPNTDRPIRRATRRLQKS